MIKKFLQDFATDSFKRLGIVGTVTWLGGLYLFKVATEINFEKEVEKAQVFIGVGVVLLAFSGFIYILENREETEKAKEALSTLRDVFNRLAEQTTKGSDKQTISITMTLNNLPEKIADVIKKTKEIQ